MIGSRTVLVLLIAASIVFVANGYVALDSLTSATSPPPFVIFGNPLVIPSDALNPPFDPSTDDITIIDLMNPFTASGIVRSWSAVGNSTGGSGVVTFIVFRATSQQYVYSVNCTNTFNWSSGQSITGLNAAFYKQFFVPLNAQCLALAGDVIGLRVYSGANVRIFKSNTKNDAYMMGWRFNINLDTTSVVDFSGTTDGSIGSRSSILVYSVQAAFYVGAVRTYECGGLLNPIACNGTAQGTCVPPGVCSCTSAWTGPYCGDDYNGCLSPSTVCFPGAQCVDVAAPGTGNTCGPCPPGYEGDGITCTDINGCAPGSNPCFGGSTCTDVAAPGVGATCSNCDPGYTGPNCDQLYDACSFNPCFPGVSCSNLPPPSTGYVCGACPTGYDGDGQVCTDHNACASNPCYANVSCVDLPPPSTSFVCGPCPSSAPLGDGVNCYQAYTCFGEQDVSLACSGHGQCVGPDQCECNIGYNGTQCENFAGYFCPWAPNVSDWSFCGNTCQSRLSCYYCCKWEMYRTPGYHTHCRNYCESKFPYAVWGNNFS